MSNASSYALGWDHVRAPLARQAMLTSRRYATVIQGAQYPDAISLTQHRHRQLEQGQAGTCWVHGPTFLAETSMVAKGYEAFDICRRLVGWLGKQLEGGGNPSNGGAPTDAILTMTQEKGAGIAHESLLPYSDDSRALGTKPPQAVFDDAKAARISVPVDVRSDDDARTLIASSTPVANGIWWPYGWDNQQTFMTAIGSGTYGHALTEVGYVMPGVWDTYDWWQLENWHGLLYPPLPADKAAKVPGYKPVTATKTSDFWVRGDVYRTVQGYGYFERVSATDLSGIGKVVKWSYDNFI